ncbi:hypothetical protein SLK237_04810 [Helicobacter pylori]
MAQKYRGLSKSESCPHTSASTEYNPLLQISRFGVIPQKSEFFVKNGLNKSFYFLKMYFIYIKNLKLYLTRFYGSSYAVFVGQKLEHVRVFGSGGWLS